MKARDVSRLAFSAQVGWKRHQICRGCRTASRQGIVFTRKLCRGLCWIDLCNSPPRNLVQSTESYIQEDHLHTRHNPKWSYLIRNRSKISFVGKPGWGESHNARNISTMRQGYQMAIEGHTTYRCSSLILNVPRHPSKFLKWLSMVGSRTISEITWTYICDVVNMS